MEMLTRAIGSNVFAARSLGGEQQRRTIQRRLASQLAAALGAVTLVLTTGCTAHKDVGETQSGLSDNPRGMVPLQHGQTMSRPGQPTPFSAPAGAHLTYYGGRVVSNVQVVQVLWGSGSYIPQVTSTASPSMATFYQGVLNSPYVDWLTEYNTNTQSGTNSNQTIGRGSFSTQVTITPAAANNGTTITDDQIQAELSAQIAAGTLPAPTHDAAGNNNTYYAIFFPHGKVITQGGGSSCSVFCAYHGTIANAGGAGEVYYGVHPDFQAGSGCESGCGSASTVFGNYTHVASHELVETITDAEVGLATTFSPPLAWYDQVNGEIGDICVGQNGNVVGSDGETYDVQKEFSNSASDCVVTLGPPAVSSLTFSPSSLEGGTTTTGTVMLTRAAPAGGATVTLVSSSPSLVTVPASVVIPAGSGSATFTVSSTQTTTQTTVTITAMYPTGTSATGTVTVLLSPTPVSLILAPTTVQGGTASAGTVTLSGPAPTGGAAVTLGSSNTSVATVPATLTIPAGATSGTFPITTITQNATTTATITAAYHGLSQMATLTVTLSPSLTQVSVSPSTLEGGGVATGTVFLNTTAPTGGLVVSLASSSGAATVPASVTVSAGLSSATFTITTISVSVQTSVTISGTFPSDVTRTAAMTVLASPTPASVTFSPNPVAGGQTTTATVTLTGPAPSGGSVVTLSSNAPSNAPVPASLSVPAGATSGTFTITTVGQSVTTTATISASLNGLTQTGLLTINRVLPVGNATYDPSLKAPRCLTADTFCDTGGLIDGRANVGPETNTPNTLGASCVDGTSGNYHSDESLDRLKVSTVDGTPLAAGKTVKIEATVWVWGASSDFLDLFFAPDATAPVWTPIATGLLGTTSQTLQVLSTTFVLPTATLPVIRGGWRFGGSATACTSGSFDDHDDLVFALATTGPPVNNPPVVNAGPDQTITLPAPASLTGTVTDDGLPNPPAAFTTTWTMVSGPGTVTFANANAASTTATFSVAGTYTLRLTANDSDKSASDDVVITVNPPVPVNQPPVVNAGPDQTVTLPAAANLAGAVTDDGLPNPPGAVTTTWSVVSGPGTVTFAAPSSLTTTATFSAAGSYILRLTANDSALAASDDIGIVVLPMNQPPVVNAGPDQTITLPAAANLNGTATDDGLPNPPGVLTTTWSVVSGPGTVTFGNAGATATTAAFSAAGSYVLRLTASDSALTASDDLAVVVLPMNQPPVVNAGPDQTITLPAAASLSGTATDDGLPNPPGVLTTTWSVVSGPGTVTFGNASAKATTATFSAAGSYVLRLTASDSALAASDDLAVTVNAASSCVTASPTSGWMNTPFASQTATFTAVFDATVSASPTNSTVAFSKGAQTAYTGFATLVRFNPAGDIDARNDGAFTAASAIPYAAGKTYHFRLAVNVPAHQYSIFVTPPGGTELTVGANFTFRTEQKTVTSLDTMGVHVDPSGTGTTTACGFAVSGSVAPPDFGLGATPASQAVAPGAAANYTATVTPSNGFTDAVALSVTGLPAGATATFTPTSITGGSGSSTMKVSTTTSTPAGSYTLTVKGTDGALQHSATVTLVVSASPPPDFGLAATPASQTVSTGAAANYTATVTPSNGFTDAVALSVTGLPAGATATFTPTSITGGSGSSTMKISTTSSTPAGSYALTVMGTDGALQHTAAVTLVVSASSSGCVTASPTNGWQNNAFAVQTGTFTAVFDATPSASPTDSTVAFSKGTQTTYTGFATLVRFSPAGHIDARNAGAFAAAATIPYAAGKTYHFRVVVNVPARTYSVFVTAPGGAEQTVGSNFAFRSEQSTVTSLSSWGVDVNGGATGTTTVCNFGIQ
jgi:hypothetical protein